MCISCVPKFHLQKIYPEKIIMYMIKIKLQECLLQNCIHQQKVGGGLVSALWKDLLNKLTAHLYTGLLYRQKDIEEYLMTPNIQNTPLRKSAQMYSGSQFLEKKKVKLILVILCSYIL